MTLYELTPEHRAQLKPWADKWIDIILNCDAMSEDEIVICKKAVKDLYKAASLKPPPDKRIVFVKSPIMGAFVAAVTQYIWWLRKTSFTTKNSIRRTTADVTRHTIKEATKTPIWEAIMLGVNTATTMATWNATTRDISIATGNATLETTRDAIREVIKEATIDAIRNTKNDKVDLSKWYLYPSSYLKFIEIIKILFKSNDVNIFLKNIINLYNGGNFWGQSLSFLTFFRYIAKLDLDYSKFDAYEKLATHSNFRFMHEKFCIISDRPLFIKRDDENHPHCNDGAFIKWSDGTAFYAIHGVRLPAWIVEKPNEITTQKIDAEENVEIRRIMIDKYRVEIK